MHAQSQNFYLCALLRFESFVALHVSLRGNKYVTRYDRRVIEECECERRVFDDAERDAFLLAERTVFHISDTRR